VSTSKWWVVVSFILLGTYIGITKDVRGHLLDVEFRSVMYWGSIMLLGIFGVLLIAIAGLIFLISMYLDDGEPDNSNIIK
jgi:hypothetical protein